MKTSLIIFLILIIFFCNANGQDTLYYKTGRKVAVKILDEYSQFLSFNIYYKISKILSVRNFNDTSTSNKYKVYEKYLNGVLYEKESRRLAVMKPSEFNSLGKKHAKTYGTALDVLSKNSDYMRGFNHKLKWRQNTQVVWYSMLGVCIITLVIGISAGNY